MKPGIYLDHELSIEEYHGDNDYISSTGLKRFINCPSDFLIYTEEEQERKHHFDLGNALEIALVIPERFEELVFVLDGRELIDEIGGSRPTSTTRYRQWKQEQYTLAGDRYIIDQSDKEWIDMVVETAMQNPLMQKIIGQAVYQPSFFWIDEDTGVKLKSRPDLVHPDINLFIDIKTAANGSPYAFGKAAIKYDYPIQAALHITGAFMTGFCNCDQYLYLVVEKNAPFNVTMYELPQDDLLGAKTVLKHYLELFSKFQDGQLRLGYEYKTADPNGIIQMQIPEYYFNR